MKKLVIILAVAIVGLAGFNYVKTGELTLVPSFSKTAQEQSVQDLQDHFNAARKQFNQAYRAAAVGGLDTTAEADAALGSIKRIKRELDKLRKGLTEDGAKRHADELSRTIKAFQDELR
jgi:hypothetical protein